MAADLLTENPFGVLTFIAAPAVLTNASSVLAMSTINRMLRTRDRMHQLYLESEDQGKGGRPVFIAHIDRVEKQGLLLLTALHWIYTALASFAGATLITLLGAVADQFAHVLSMRIVIAAGLILGIAGVTGLVGGCVNLFKATQLSLISIREEAAAIRARQEERKS